MNRSRMGKELREKLGQDIVARKVFEIALEKGLEKVVFVGPRSVSEIDFFREKIPGFKLVAVRAGQEKRFVRRSSKDGQTREKFLERDRHDKESFELGKVIEMADFTIENNSTIDDFHRSIDELMQKI